MDSLEGVFNAILSPQQIILLLGQLVSKSLGKEAVVDSYQIEGDAIAVDCEDMDGNSFSGKLTQDGGFENGG